MRPSRLVTYQVCRPGEGSVPGRSGLVVAVGTVTAAVSAMATMTAAMTAAAKQHEAEWTAELVRRALAQEAAQ